jgi:hypothetical protein
MAVYRQVHVDFWQDGFVLDLTPEEKYFFLYLMTNSKTTQCGIYELPKRIIETETGYNRETVEKLLDRFADYGKIEYCNETKEIMILNWIKYNKINSPKVKQCILKELSRVKNQTFINRFYSLCKQFGYCIDTLPKDHGEEKEEEKEEEKKNRRQKYDDDSPYLKMAEYLLQKIKEWKPDFVFRGDLQKWANDFRLMNEVDHRTKESIKAVIEWTTKDPFWQTKIMSAEKLRKQFDALEGQMRNEKRKVTPVSGGYSPPGRPNAFSQIAVSPIALERERRKRKQQKDPLFGGV